MQVHRHGVASRHDERRAFSLSRADRAENGPLIDRSARARAALRPSSRGLVLLANAPLVGEPELYRAGIEALLPPDLLQARGEAF
jgi:hypothetical protein